MGIIVKWALPDTDEVTYDTTEIHRATSEAGSYSLIASQAIADNTYFDIDGSSTNWYKVRFELDGTYSDFSEPIQGGKFNGYCSFDDVRDIAGVPTTTTDSQIFNLIKNFGIAQINRDVGIEWRDERVRYISSERQNDIDGSNTTFYARNWPLGDLDNDGIVDEDDLELYSLDSDGTRTEFTVSSVDDVWLSKFTLTTAPTDSRLFIQRYRSVQVEVYPNVDPLIRMACAQFVGAMSYTKINASKTARFKVGKVTVMEQSNSFKDLMSQYNQTLFKIRSKIVKRKDHRDVISDGTRESNSGFNTFRGTDKFNVIR